MSQDTMKKKTQMAEKQKSLDLAIAHIEKQFGTGSIMTFGKHSASSETSVIPTGAISLDAALGIDRVPRGRIVASAQKTKGIAAYIDAEHALDPKAELEGEIGDSCTISSKLPWSL